MKFESWQTEKYQKGVLSFIPEDPSVTHLDHPMMGKGKVRYGEGSVYEGPLSFDGSHFNKIGYGTQDFSESSITSDEVGGPLRSLLYLYQGEYDYRKTDWIYGNGVFYFLDEERKPLAYSKGFFAGLRKVKDYEGDFPLSSLLPGFTPAMEIADLIPHRRLVRSLECKYASVRNTDILFCGDSWMEFWNYQSAPGIPDLYASDMRGRKTVNVGIGGSAFRDWFPLIPALITCHHPKKIVVNLGFNDLHYETSPEETLKDSEEFVRRVRKDLPDAKIYLLNVCHLHGPIYYFRREIQYNRLLEETWKGQKDISVIPVDQVFLKDGEIRPDMDSLCALDLYHLNVRGYRLWVSFFLPYVDRENGSIIARR